MVSSLAPQASASANSATPAEEGLVVDEQELNYSGLPIGVKSLPKLREWADSARSRVGMWRGGLRLRFHTPLIEPCWRISRTRLSDKDSCGRLHEAASSTLQAAQAQSLMEVCVGKP